MFMGASTRSPGFGHFRFAEFSGYAEELWNSVEEPVIQLTAELTLKMLETPTARGPMKIIHQRSACGYWIYAVLNSQSDQMKNIDLGKSCGLGWLCKKCTDPFEYDYYQNLGRRLVREPKWNTMIADGYEDENQHLLEMIKGAKKMYEEDEKKKKDSGDVRLVQTVWGFREKDSEGQKASVISENSESDNSVSSEDVVTSGLEQLSI